MRRGRKGAACGVSADLDGKLTMAVQGNGPLAGGPFRAVGQGWLRHPNHAREKDSTLS